jgi:hypothetical protein
LHCVPTVLALLLQTSQCFLPLHQTQLRQVTADRFWKDISSPFLLSSNRDVSRSISVQSSQQKSSVKSNNNPHVVYQKVVRLPPSVSEAVFLGVLVEFLQDRFELPPRLPMVYEKTIFDDSSRQALLEWKSSLSPDAVATTLSLQVVAIYPKSTPTISDASPSSSSIMAMVVVEKAVNAPVAWKRLPPMLQNLFAESEKQILKSLDRELDDFSQSKSLFTESASSVASSTTFREAQAAVLEDYWTDPTALSSNVMDAEFEKELHDSAAQGQSASTHDQRRAALESMQKAATDRPLPRESIAQPTTAGQTPSLDFAVQAAATAKSKRSKKSTAKKTATKEGSEQDSSIPTLNDTVKPNEEFAVQAAKAAAAKLKQSQTVKQSKSQIDTSTAKHMDSTDDEDDDDDEGKSTSVSEMPLDMSQLRPPSLDPDATGSRTFMTTISRPEDYINRRRKQLDTQQQQTLTKRKLKVLDVDSSTNIPKDSPVVSTDDLSPKQGTLKSPPKTKGQDVKSRKLNLSEKNETLPGIAQRNKDVSSSSTAPNGYGEMDEAYQATEAALNEMARSSEDMTPEELMHSVMKFGDEVDRDNEEGRGFVSGAFDKAKELLQEQNRRRETRLRQTVVDRVVDKVQGFAPDIRDPDEKNSPLSYEDEVRQMFEAGARIAGGRLSVNSPTGGALGTPKGTTAEDVDALIAAEKTISPYARVLDDELVELELRLNKSPGQEFDGPTRGRFMDPLSGPEVYNPNVDPETATNWPGAAADTRSRRFPKQLNEAIQQANFAAEILMKINDDSIANDGDKASFKVGSRTLSQKDIDALRTVVDEAVQVGIIDDPLLYLAEKSRMQILLDELWQQPEERFRDIASSYKDLLFSDNFVPLIKERMHAMAERDIEALRNDDTSLEDKHKRERELLGSLVAYAQLLLKQTQALGAEIEAQQLEVIRSICKVAMDPSHRTEEDTAIALADAVRDMRPLFDDAFVAYLKFAIAEEEGKLARAGLLDDPEHNQWLFVLKIVQQGVYRELSRSVSRYIDHIWYILRMETASERRMLLKKLIDVMPTLDVRPFIQVVENIVGSLGDSVDGNFADVNEIGDMTNKLLQLRKDVHELLPPERVAIMSRDADEWAARRRKQLEEQRNLTIMRLQAAHETEKYDSELEALGRRGEMERIE